MCMLKSRAVGRLPSDPELFTIEIHHGGYLKKGKYVGGTVQWADNCNTYQLSMLDLHDVAESLGYNHIKVYYRYRSTTLGYVAIRVDLDVFEFVREIPASRVHSLYITEKPEPTLLENEVSATVFNFQKLLPPQLIHVDVQDDVNIADDSDDEGEDEEHDYEQTDEEQGKQKGAEDDMWFDRHVVDEAVEEPQREPGDVPSDDYNSEDLLSVSEEEDEVDENIGVKKVSRRRKAPREAIRFYAVSSARPLRWVKNDPHRIKTYQPKHVCERTKFATSSWLAQGFDEDLRDNPNMSVSDFMKIVRKNYDIDITANQFYKAKSRAKERIHGSIEEQYAKLWDYCEELKANNPGSTVLTKTDLRRDNPGTHPGQILYAVGIDANNGMYPVAFAMVEMFMSYKQKGLGQGIRDLIPTAEHRHCVRHLHNNFKIAGHNGLALKQRLWTAAGSITILRFDVEMEKM
ncbi:unnamed protein product [Prunus armeniaca]